MHDIPYDPETESIYECLDCGATVTSTDHLLECPTCSSTLRNRSMPIE